MIYRALGIISSVIGWLEGEVFFQPKADDGVYRSVSRGFLQLHKRVGSETFRQMT